MIVLHFGQSACYKTVEAPHRQVLWPQELGEYIYIYTHTHTYIAVCTVRSFSSYEGPLC